MATKPQLKRREILEDGIYFVRCQKVMLDFDLAKIYGVTTKRLKEQFRRNRDRFPSDFAFELTARELADVRAQVPGDQLFDAIRELLKPPAEEKPREIGFHVKEQARKYKVNLNGARHA